MNCCCSLVGTKACFVCQNAMSGVFDRYPAPYHKHADDIPDPFHEGSDESPVHPI
jgi:hypothetical protein